METTEQQPEIVKEFPKRNCKQCGNEFPVKHNRAEYCSSTCRSVAFRKRGPSVSPINETQPTKPLPMMQHSQPTQLVANMRALPPDAQYIITSQEREISRWETMYKEEKEKRKKLQQDLLDTKEQLKQIQFDHKIEALENARPSGLQGIVESLPEPVLAHLAPVLGKLAEKFLLPNEPGALPMAGTDGQLDSEVQNKVAQFNQWFISLPKDMQESVYAMLVKLANASTPEALVNNLQTINNILNNGTATPTIPFTGTY